VEKKMGPGEEKYSYHAYLTENQDMYFPFPCGKSSEPLDLSTNPLENVC